MHRSMCVSVCVSDWISRISSQEHEEEGQKRKESKKGYRWGEKTNTIRRGESRIYDEQKRDIGGFADEAGQRDKVREGLLFWFFFC